MDFFGGDDASFDPIEVIKIWVQNAQSVGECEPTAVNLASVDECGMPNIRVVYAREIEANGVVFYTNYEGRKGVELGAGKAALNYYFPKSQRQIRLRGIIEKVSAEQSDTYFLSRPHGSRLGAWVSRQSQLLDSRDALMKAWENIDPSKALKRPDNWGGFRLIPLEIEFWAMGEFRLHDRIRWTRGQIFDREWILSRLYP